MWDHDRSIYPGDLANQIITPPKESQHLRGEPRLLAVPVVQFFVCETSYSNGGLHPSHVYEQRKEEKGYIHLRHIHSLATRSSDDFKSYVLRACVPVGEDARRQHQRQIRVMEAVHASALVATGSTPMRTSCSTMHANKCNKSIPI